MKRKMITAKQLQNLINAGIVERVNGGYRRVGSGYRLANEDSGTLWDGEVYDALVGHTLEVHPCAYDDMFPVIAVAMNSGEYLVPYWVLACNYKKLRG